MFSLKLESLCIISVIFVNISAKLCNPGPADVIFVLGSDLSLDQTEYLQKMKVVKNFVDSVKIGPNDVRVGLITEYNFADLEFPMDDHMSKQELQSAISFTYYQGGYPVFGSGLEYINDHDMNVGLGGRPGVPDVVIFLTNGYPSDYTLAQNEAQKLSASGATVIALGAGGRIDKSNLIDVASGCHYIAQTPSLTLTDQLAGAAVNLTCDALNKVPLDDCECDMKADIIFLLDASSSQGKDDFKEQLDFTRDVVSELNIASNETRVAAVTYSTNHHYQFDLDSHMGKQELDLALSFIPFQADDDRKPSDGLAFIRNNMSFVPGIPSRDDAEKIVIVTATRPLSNPTAAKAEALRLKNLGVKIFFVGIGGGHQQGLNSLATNSYYDAHFDTVSQLLSAAPAFAKTICQNKRLGMTSTNVTTTSKDVCVGNLPCKNGGKCVDVMGVKSCQCQPNYSGNVCHQLATPSMIPTTTVTTSKAMVPTTTGIHKCNFNPCNNGGTCIVLGDMYECHCPPGYHGLTCGNSDVTSTKNPSTTPIPTSSTTIATTPPATTTGPSCPSYNGTYWPCGEAEVIFMIEHAEADIGSAIDHQRDFIQGLIKNYNLNASKVRVGVIEYNTTGYDIVDLDDHPNDPAGLKNSIGQITGRGKNATGDVDFAQALEYVREHSFYGSRRDVPRIIISVNHQEPSRHLKDIKPEVERLRDECIDLTMFGVRVSQTYEDTLRQLPNTTFFPVSSFSYLEILGQSYRLICPDI